MTNPEEKLREALEKIVTVRLNAMPNYEEYMINSTVRILVVNDILDLIHSHTETIIKPYEEYVDFLEKHLQSNAVYMHVHGMGASEEDIKEGERLRANITAIKQASQ